MIIHQTTVSHPDALAPLVAVGVSFVAELFNNKPSQVVLTNAENFFRSYLKGEIPYHTAAQLFMANFSSTKPLDKITAILNMQDKPLPNLSDYPIEAKAFLLRKKSRPWSEYEDLRLMAGINKYGLDGWGSVAQFVGNSRTKAQCCQRWVRGLDPRISKVQWTEDEDRRLLDLVAKYGQKSWTKIAADLGNRCDVQCRYRFKQLTANNTSNSKHSSDNEENPNAPNNIINNNNVNNNINKVFLPSIDSFLPMNAKTEPSNLVMQTPKSTINQITSPMINQHKITQKILNNGLVLPIINQSNKTDLVKTS